MSSAGLDAKKKRIYAAVIGVCIVGAIATYILQRPVDESKTPAGQAAVTNSDAIQKSMEAEAAKQPPPKDTPPILRTRGAVVPPPPK